MQKHSSEEKLNKLKLLVGTLSTVKDNRQGENQVIMKAKLDF